MRLEEDGLLSGWTGGSGTWTSSVLHWMPGGLSGMVPWGWAPVWPPQPTWAHVRKAGMSLTGTFLVSAFTRRFRSSVSSTTSRSRRIGSSVGTESRWALLRIKCQMPFLVLRGMWSCRGKPFPFSRLRVSLLCCLEGQARQELCRCCELSPPTGLLCLVTESTHIIGITDLPSRILNY